MQILTLFRAGYFYYVNGRGGGEKRFLALECMYQRI